MKKNLIILSSAALDLHGQTEKKRKKSRALIVQGVGSSGEVGRIRPAGFSLGTPEVKNAALHRPDLVSLTAHRFSSPLYELS